MRFAITALTAVSAIGDGLDAIGQSLINGQGGLGPCAFGPTPVDTMVGEVAGLDDCPLEGTLARYDCRNNRLGARTLATDHFDERVADARGRLGADRIAVIMGTSTAGILQTETAYRQSVREDGALPDWFHYKESHNTFSITDFTRRKLRLRGVALSLSTACSSSAKAFASAARIIEAGLADAAVVGGVDTLCMTTLCGFNSLALLSSTPCRPCDKERDGISIGEAGAYALIEPADRVAVGSDQFGALIGYGESSDGHHISSPHPEGIGAERAMRAALAKAGITPDTIDYINMHGTASLINDSVEDRAIHRVFGAAIPCSSTKGWTGHTLGAASALEAVIAILAMRDNVIPGSLNTTEVDPAFQSAVQLEHERDVIINRVISNSFGFGGSNAALIFEA